MLFKVTSVLVFVGVNLVGDPVEMLINPEADQAEVEWEEGRGHRISRRVGAIRRAS